MTRGRLPLVSNNHVLGLDGAGEKIAPVVVGSGAWYTWLADQQIQSFSFRNLLGSFTARRERKRHGWYWYAYRKRTGRLRKAYLGKTEELTLERLNAVALVCGAKWKRPVKRVYGIGRKGNGAICAPNRQNESSPIGSISLWSGLHFAPQTSTTLLQAAMNRTYEQDTLTLKGTR